MNRFEEKTVASKKIFEGKIISLRVDDVELPDGKHAKRELVDHPGAVAVIAITDDGKLVLVEQYRKALNRSIIEIPAGKIDPGEDIEVTALRELEEETGYGANKFEYLQSFATSPGFANEIIHIFVAQGLYKIDKPAAGDEDEFLQLYECTIAEAEEMVLDQRIYDAKTAFAILHAKRLLNN
ncbi:NUDIX domain-containing protein [Sporosarcina sp. Marseille-Q4943]|uniref:NUDIX domain-containing protein n=1 Tax=Sporosarcina sp. Marseille-Q4943 TaxID=2942204 RepID=UPI00208DDA55|nr:NUDIX hydrolase [Sporosarcina sp. Marseille-Q4943]